MDLMENKLQSLPVMEKETCRHFDKEDIMGQFYVIIRAVDIKKIRL